MTREEFFKTDRNAVIYGANPTETTLAVPVTRVEFESLLQSAASINDLPVDDKLRSTLAGYIHHIPNDQDTLTVASVAKVLMKSVSNDITWTIDQECKKKAQKEAIEEANKIKDNVTSIEPKKVDSLSEL